MDPYCVHSAEWIDGERCRCKKCGQTARHDWKKVGKGVYTCKRCRQSRIEGRTVAERERNLEHVIPHKWRDPETGTNGQGSSRRIIYGFLAVIILGTVGTVIGLAASSKQSQSPPSLCNKGTICMVAVQGAGGWQNVHYYVKPREAVVITYKSGQWNIGNWPSSDANGPLFGGQPYIASKALAAAGDNPSSAVEQMPNRAKGGLIARIGNKVYFIGDHRILPPTSGGWLLLCQNNSTLPSDQQTGNGYVIVDIRPG